MDKHTPGPWTAYKSTSYLDETPSWIVPGVAHCGDGELSEANARLIAAAPDMLAALERVWEAYSPQYVSAMADDCERTALDDAFDTVRSVIAKARGE